MKVVMIIPYDLFYKPFAIRTIEFARELSRRGHVVDVFHSPLPDRGAEPIHARGEEAFRVHDFESHRLRSWKSLSRAVAGADVVHFQKASPGTTLAAVALARRHDKPLHQDWDDDDLAFCVEALGDSIRDRVTPPPARLLRMVKAVVGVAAFGTLEWSIPKLVDTMGASSMALRRKSSSWGCPPESIFPARVGVDCRQFHPRRRDEDLRRKLGLRGPTALYSGYLDLHQDLRFFVQALRAMIAEAPEAQCLVVGGAAAAANSRA